MTIPIEAVSALVRCTELSKEQIFWMINETWPEVSDEELEAMWRARQPRYLIQ